MGTVGLETESTDCASCKLLGAKIFFGRGKFVWCVVKPVFEGGFSSMNRGFMVDFQCLVREVSAKRFGLPTFVVLLWKEQIR